MSEFLRACRKSIVLSFNPLDLAVLMKSCRMTSSILDLVNLVITPARIKPRDKAGSMRFFASPEPKTGVRFSQKENIRISMIASQKFGIEATVSDPIVANLSKSKFCFMAE